MPFRSHRNSRISLCVQFLLLLLLLPLAANAKPLHSVELSSDTQTATAGYFQLRWQGDESHAHYRLLESDNPRFSPSKVLYQGPDLATVISGKHNGSYYYRVAELKGSKPVAVSNTVMVEVAHHSLAKAFLFFAIGAIVFLATLSLILQGNRHSKRDI